MKYDDGTTVHLGDIVQIPMQDQISNARVVMLGDTQAHLEIDVTLPLESVSLSRSRIGLHGLRRKPIFLELHRADIGQRRVHAGLVVPE
jgi:hypothetical protein